MNPLISQILINLAILPLFSLISFIVFRITIRVVSDGKKQMHHLD